MDFNNRNRNVIATRRETDAAMELVGLRLSMEEAVKGELEIVRYDGEFIPMAEAIECERKLAAEFTKHVSEAVKKPGLDGDRLTVAVGKRVRAILADCDGKAVPAR